MAKLVLGRGLGALIQARPAHGEEAGSPSAAGQPAPGPGEVVRQVSLEEIQSSPFQPRQEFRPESLNELIESIREQGIIQPLIVRRVNQHYELIAGERRWRAAKTLGLAKAPVILREATDQEVLELALIENLQRADLNIVEEARAYARLADEFSLRQEDIARKVGKSRAAVANAMRLLDLEPQVQSWLTQDRITIGHAKVLLALKSPQEQRVLAEIVIRQRSTVRAAERLVEDHLKRQGALHIGPGSRAHAGSRSAAAAELTPILARVQSRLRDHLGTFVSLRPGEKKGAIEIEYYGDDDLNRLLKLMGLPED